MHKSPVHKNRTPYNTHAVESSAAFVNDSQKDEEGDVESGSNKPGTKSLRMAPNDPNNNDSMPQSSQIIQMAPLAKEANTSAEVSPAVSGDIEQMKGNGAPLAPNIQREMNQSFNHDFSQVAIHTGDRAVSASEAIQAKAFTVGNDVFFNKNQYNPGTREGKHLLAHELTHTIQQGQSNNGASTIQPIQRKPKETLEERAKREAKDGHPQLQQALNKSFSKPLSFNFSTHLKGATKFNLTEGSKVKIEVKGDTTASSKVGEKYTISLMGSSGKHGKSITFPMESSVYLTQWTNIPKGEYYFEFDGASGNDLTFAGKIWVSVTSGSGVTTSGDKDKDSLEKDLSVKVGGTSKGVPAKAYGQYVLRSQPVSSSFIYGTLPGTPIDVVILDKVSFASNDVSGDKSYYKIKFKSASNWSTNAINEPHPNFSVAYTNFVNKEAWVSGKAIKAFIPYAAFIQLIRKFEARPEIAKLSVKKRVRVLRQLYADPNLAADSILGTSKIASELEDRVELSRMLHMFKGPITGVEFPGGERIDMGHVILGLDGLQFPDTEYSSFDTGYINAGFKHAFLTWSGDTGAAAADYVKDHLEQGKTKNKVDPSLMKYHFDKSAPDSDLLGDIDAFGTLIKLQAKSAPASVENLLVGYYGGSINKKDATLSANRADAIKKMLKYYGFTKPTSLTSQKIGLTKIYDETYKFSRVWFYKDDYWTNEDIMLIKASVNVTFLFLDRMEAFAKKYGLTSL